MADLPREGRNSVRQQFEMFRLADRDYGLSIAAIADASDLKLSTLKGWKNGAAMPAWGLFALGDAGVPDHLLSLVAGPFGKHVSSNGEGCWEEICELATLIGIEYNKARLPSSPGQEAVVPQEREPILEMLDKLKAHARRCG